MGYLKASAISLASTCLALGAASAQAPAEPVRYSAEAFYDTTSFVMASPAGYGFSADGQAILISSDNPGVFKPYALPEIGRASCRERVCQTVSLSEVPVHIKNTHKQ